MIIRPEQGRVYKQGLGEIHMLVTGEQTGGQWWLVEACEFPGFTTSLHLHPKTVEQVYVLEGVLSVYLDDQWHDSAPEPSRSCLVTSRTLRPITARRMYASLELAFPRGSINSFPNWTNSRPVFRPLIRDSSVRYRNW